MIQFEGIGNVGQRPEKKMIKNGDGEEHALVTFSVYFPHDVKNGESYDDKYGSWRDVAIWNPTLGERVMKVVDKGMRVRVSGQEICRKWTDESSGLERAEHSVRCADLTLDLLGIEAVTRSTSA